MAAEVRKAGRVRTTDDAPDPSPPPGRAPTRCRSPAIGEAAASLPVPDLRDPVVFTERQLLQALYPVPPAVRPMHRSTTPSSLEALSAPAAPGSCSTASASPLRRPLRRGVHRGVGLRRRRSTRHWPCVASSPSCRSPRCPRATTAPPGSRRSATSTPSSRASATSHLGRQIADAMASVRRAQNDPDTDPADLRERTMALHRLELERVAPARGAVLMRLQWTGLRRPARARRRGRRDRARAERERLLAWAVERRHAAPPSSPDATACMPSRPAPTGRTSRCPGPWHLVDAGHVERRRRRPAGHLGRRRAPGPVRARPSPGCCPRRCASGSRRRWCSPRPSTSGSGARPGSSSARTSPRVRCSSQAVLGPGRPQHRPRSRRAGPSRASPGCASRSAWPEPSRRPFSSLASALCYRCRALPRRSRGGLSPVAQLAEHSAVNRQGCWFESNRGSKPAVQRPCHRWW